MFRCPVALAALVSLATLGCTGGQGSAGVATAGVGPLAPQVGAGGSGAHLGTRRATAAAPVAAGSAEAHAVFSLVDNRWLAHREHEGGLLVVAGTPGFAKYLRFGRPAQPWRLGAQLNGRPVAQLIDKRAGLDVPLTAAQASAARSIRFSLHSKGKRKLDVTVNGKKEKRLALRDGWQVVHLPLDAGRLVAGENLLALEVGRGRPVSLEWMLVGGPDAADASATPAAPAADEALHLRRHESLAWYVFVPPHVRLSVETPGAGCGLHVQVDAEDAHAAGAPAQLDLAPLAGRVARLELRLDARATCAEATIARAALELPGRAAVEKRPSRPKHVVFWIMDTLRYDRVPLWFPGAVAEVPNLARLADSGTVFLNHYPGGNESTVSHASMFTSLRPGVHNVISLDGHRWKFERGWPTIGQVVRAAGMYVAGVTANGHIDRSSGFGWGFQQFENPMSEGKYDRDYGYGGDKVVARGLELVAKHKDEPFFLYLGTIDTHVPWRAYEPWVSRYDAVNGVPYRGKFKRVATAGGVNVSFMLSRTAPEPRDAARLDAIYASDVSFQDEQLGKLLARLEAWGILDETMIIVTGDHGEEFWEHGIGGHGGSLHEPVVHVPMLVWYPPLFPHTVVDEGTEGVDIFPTIVDALGLALPPELQGASLLPLAQGVGRGYPRPAIASHWEAANAMRMERWKLVAESSGASRLYDVVGDPDERTELSDTRPIELRWMTDAYSLSRVFERSFRKSSWGTGANMTADAARRLQAQHE
jgi:arylsulfatase A-like enzyme